MADIKNKIETEVKLDTSSAIISVNKLGDGIKNTSKDLEEGAKDTGKLAKEQKALKKSSEGASSGMAGLDKASGGLLSSFKALLANPIGIVLAALVGVFALLSKVVGRSGKASETFSKIGTKLSGVFNGILAVLEPVVEFIGEKLLKAMDDPLQSIKDLGTAIKENLLNRFEGLLIIGNAVKLFFEGEFGASAKLAKEGLLQFGTGVTDVEQKLKDLAETAAENFNKAATATEGLANKERRLLANRQALEKQQLTSLRLAEEQRQIRDDTSKDIEDRIAANTKLGAILEEQGKIEMALAEQALGIAQQEVTASGQTIENLTALGDAELKLLEIQERITGQRSEQIVNEVGLLKERADLIQADIDIAAEDEVTKAERASRDIDAQIEIDALKLEQLMLAGENTLQAELDILDRRMAQELDNADLTANEKLLIEAQFKDAKEKLTKAREEGERKAVEVTAALAIGAAADVFGFNKEVAIAEMLIAAPKAIGSVWAVAGKKLTLPAILAHGIGGTAIVLAPIIKGLSEIKKARFPATRGRVSGGGTRGGGGSISGSIGGGGAGNTNITPELISDISANNAARLGIDPALGAAATAAAASNVAGETSSNVVFSESRFQDFKAQVDFKEEKITIG